MTSTLSAETVGLHMKPKDSRRARVRVLRTYPEEELTRALELASTFSLTLPGYGPRRTVVTLRKALEKPE